MFFFVMGVGHVHDLSRICVKWLAIKDASDEKDLPDVRSFQVVVKSTCPLSCAGRFCSDRKDHRGQRSPMLTHAGVRWMQTRSIVRRRKSNASMHTKHSRRLVSIARLR